MLDHWHLLVNDGTEECGPFSIMSQKALQALWLHLVPVERACVRYGSRMHLRCDRCQPCRVYDRLDASVHWLREMREMFLIKRDAFEVRRADLNFDEVLPCGTRLQVRLRDPKVPCFLYDELDLR